MICMSNITSVQSYIPCS